MFLRIMESLNETIDMAVARQPVSEVGRAGLVK